MWFNGLASSTVHFSLGLCYFPPVYFSDYFPFGNERLTEFLAQGTVIKLTSCFFFLFFLQWVNYICFVLSIFCNEEPHMNSYHLKICICLLFLLSNILWKYLYFSFVAHTELLKNICFPSAKSCCPPAIIHSQIDRLVTLRWQKNLRIYSIFLTSALCDHTGV